MTPSVLFYNSIQGFAETSVTREDIELLDKEWFLAILRIFYGTYQTLTTDKKNKKMKETANTI